MMYMLRNCVSDSVYQIIESDIHKDWNLSMVASCLCLSPSLLKKKLKSENTSYSQIITTCRMRYAVNELMMDGKISLRSHSRVATTVRRTLFLSLKTSTV